MALKLKTFYDLGYTSDLFVSVQLARSWLEGRGLLTANCFQNMLATHTYFLLLPLGLIAKPFGAPGLLFVLAVSIGATYFWTARVLRLLGVADPIAVVASGILLVAPFSVAFYQEQLFGFHVEVLAPALCLILFYSLLRQRMAPLERQHADEVFGRYRREAKPQEPVIASAMLFRYAHDRNLFWLDRLNGLPSPIWILGDSSDNYAPFRISVDTINPISGIKMNNYIVINHRGRFVLLEKKNSVP